MSRNQLIFVVCRGMLATLLVGWSGAVSLAGSNGITVAVLLLHGGFVDSRMFEPALEHLRSFRLLTVDRRGHGRTPDVDGAFTYELMADDTIAFLDEVVGGPAALVGYSDGANVAMEVARRRPDLVSRQVLISGNFHHGGILPGVMEGFGHEDVLAFLGHRYGEVSPDGEDHFPTVARKTLRMGTEGPTLSTDARGTPTVLRMPGTSWVP